MALARTLLARELREELNVGAVVGPEILSTTHEYDERRVELHFFRCTVTGPATPMLGQEMRWVARADLTDLPFPPADAELIQRLTNGSA